MRDENDQKSKRVDEKPRTKKNARIKSVCTKNILEPLEVAYFS